MRDRKIPIIFLLASQPHSDCSMAQSYPYSCLEIFSVTDVSAVFYYECITFVFPFYLLLDVVKY